MIDSTKPHGCRNLHGMKSPGEPAWSESQNLAADAQLDKLSNEQSMVMRESVREWLFARISDEVQSDSEQVDTKEPLTSYGLTCSQTMTIVRDLERWLGLPRSITLACDRPTIGALVESACNALDKAASRGMSIDEQAAEQSQRLKWLLDDVYGQLQDLDTVDCGMRGLVESLWEIRQSSSRRLWKALKSSGLRHPIRLLLHEDPFTRRAYLKPRGYPGDAGLMEIIYGEGESVKKQLARSTQRGRLIYNWLMRFSGAVGVRSRRDYLAALIDETAKLKCRPSILSIACGHLREAGPSEAISGGHLGRFLALDQDLTSLKEVDREYSRYGVRIMHRSVRDLLTDSTHLRGFDLVYSAGLFDYLKGSTAQQLLEVMFQMLNPGGRVLISNALPTVRDAGYMEIFMDWHLLYRSLDELRMISSSIPSHQIAQQREWGQESRHFGFMELIKV